MAGVKDVVQLKLQKRLLEEKLLRNEQKVDRLGEIIHKKTTGGFSIQNHSPDRNIMTLSGMTVNDFRIPSRSIKAVSKVQEYDPYSTLAVPLTNQNILRIRIDQKLKTVGRNQIKEKIKEKELEAIRKVKPPRKLPKIKIPESMLPNRYKRGELPCTIEHGRGGTYLSWACPLENLDYEYYLPLFFDGLQITEYPVSFIARQAIEDMLYSSRGFPERINPVVPLLVRPLRNALAKFNTEVMLATLKALEQLILCNDGIGEVLMPFSKQFLAPLSFFMDDAKNTGDKMDYGQRKNDDVAEQILKIMELMEVHGGPKALQLIKFSVPLCMKIAFL